MSEWNKWRIVAKDAAGTHMRAVFLSPHSDVFKALEDFRRRNPGWAIKSMSLIQPLKRSKTPQVR